ncbi:MAG: sodium-translocating pyrophosphatase [Eubacteriales bacterium]|nr:sodium-translocating pyrophosphatase [Eubacteriales bacterium]MDD3198046.1 sodium-translocating pyrophosphatase [Eubacteriales bacterium]MDD3503365.1 sodium-translocating pyrophosphatase [Eubacteriales bacterium]MDD4682547.1 sodium-translocating pyrophosphatase [Eubacteriales bacterium]
MYAFIISILIAVVITLGFAAYNFRRVSKMDAGTELMQEIARAIQEGSDSFIAHEYKIIASAAIVIALLLGVIIDWYVGVAFAVGTIMSALAGFIGMKIATISNVRVSNEARITKDLGKTMKVALRGGSVMGLSVGGLGLLGLLIVYVVFGIVMGQVDAENVIVVENWLGISFIPFTMTVTGYSLGCSVVALFDRVGGGIYTKAADMGADLVGKTEAHIPEDDPRNPATIADNVGDNVGDVAGLGSDLLESYIGAIISCIVLASYMFFTGMHGDNPISSELLSKMLVYPILFSALGLAACVIGIAYVLMRKSSDSPHRELNISLWSSAAMIIAGGAVLTFFFFRDMNVTAAGFKLGTLSPWVAAVIGIVAGIAIGYFAERYTSYDYKHTQKIAHASKGGTALTITNGLAVGMKSVFLPVITLAIAVIASNAISGIYGVAMAAIGMLSFLAATVSVDTYGPIADNAGGISEMSKLEPEVRQITDKLDSVGNTTAAIGKGFAIGSAALASLSLLVSFMYAQVGINDKIVEVSLNIINSYVLAGAFVGAAMPFLFSSLLIDAVAKSAGDMVNEVRRQFRESPGILTGAVKPDYKRCITISAAGALREMKLPVLLAVGVPLVSGFVFGPSFAGGLLIGATISAVMLALFSANSGGAWDNAKKYVEAGGVEGEGKGSPTHDAAVIGDTVGDPLKDTVGPSLDILIKIMSTVSLIAVSIYSHFNLFDLF